MHQFISIKKKKKTLVNQFYIIMFNILYKNYVSTKKKNQ